MNLPTNKHFAEIFFFFASEIHFFIHLPILWQLELIAY